MSAPWIRETALAIIANPIVHYSSPFGSPLTSLSDTSPAQASREESLGEEALSTASLLVNPPNSSPYIAQVFYFIRKPNPVEAMADHSAKPAMPPCGHATAPTFDPADPQNLRRFFRDVEVLFERSRIVADQ